MFWEFHGTGRAKTGYYWKTGLRTGSEVKIDLNMSSCTTIWVAFNSGQVTSHIIDLKVIMKNKWNKYKVLSVISVT